MSAQPTDHPVASSAPIPSQSPTQHAHGPREPSKEDLELAEQLVYHAKGIQPSTRESSSQTQAEQSSAEVVDAPRTPQADLSDGRDASAGAHRFAAASQSQMSAGPDQRQGLDVSPMSGQVCR